MSPELETLDQLLGSDLSLDVFRNLYPDSDAFRQGLPGLLSSGDVCLLRSDQTTEPEWRWKALFGEGAAMNELRSLKLSITAQGIRRIT
jgi:hypothetical protein